MEHYDIENKLNCMSEWHNEIINYLEEVYEYDELTESEYIQAYEEVEKLFEEGEID